VFVLSAVQTISGFALAAISGVQACLQTIADVNKAPPRKNQGDPMRRDLATPSIEMLAEILTMRRRSATTAILVLLQLIVGFFIPFLNQYVNCLFLEGPDG
jgi:hypothetical protein